MFVVGLFVGAAIVAGVLGATELAAFFLVATIASALLLDETIELADPEEPEAVV